MRMLSNVRSAVPADIPVLLELMRELARFEDYIEAFCVDEQQLLARAFGQAQQCEVFVAQWADQIAGYAVVLEIPFTYDLRPTLVLKELYVAAHCRSYGLGSAMLQHIAQAFEVGCAGWEYQGRRFLPAFGGQARTKVDGV